MTRLLAVLGLLFATVASAATEITGTTGTLAHGQALTINGTGFGTKPVPAPLRFDNFEGGTNGSLYNGNFMREGSDEVTWSNARLRTNSTMSVECEFLKAGLCGGDWASNFGVWGIGTLSKIYIDAWYYGRYPTVRSRNHKLFRIHSNFNGSPNLYFNAYCGASVHIDQDGAYCDPGPCSDIWITLPGGGSSLDYLANKWTHLQGYFEHSTGSAEDGDARMWVDHVKYLDDTNWANAPPGETDLWDAFFFGNYMAHDGACGPGVPCTDGGFESGDTWTYWDDAYIDTTQAHVEIGDAPTYTACTQREIQIPTSWSSTSINITLNQGAFADLVGKYAYVTNRDGVVNTGGFPLTGIDPPPPPPPPSSCASTGAAPPATITHVQTAAVTALGGASSGSRAFSLNVTSGNKIIVQIDNGVSGGPRTVTSVTKLSGTATVTAFSAAGSGQTWGTTRRNETWRGDVTGSGTLTLLVTMSGTTDFSFVQSEFSGLKTIAAGDVDVSGGAGGTSNAASTALTTTNAADLIVGAMGHGNASVSLTPGSGYTQLAESESATFMPIHAEFQVFTTTGSKTVDVALGGSVTWGIYAVAFKAQ